jgi:uncharacterized membrane protein YeaQ/YmgE (transglycosylase-associated protein family)
MIGMDFISFLILLVISIVVSAVLHYGFKIYVRPGFGSFMSKIIFGWIGAWLGSPVLGYWFKGLAYHDVYIIPAILGSLALLVIMVDLVKSSKQVLSE